MPHSLVQTVAPTVEPVTAAEAKAHCRIDISTDDDLIQSLIVAARVWCEKRLGQSFITQTWRLTFDRFPCEGFEIPNPPAISVSSITYYDTTNTLQTLSSSVYQVDSYSRPGRVGLAFAQVWPITYCRFNAVSVTYTAGYGATAAFVPQPIKQAILLLVGHWYENREAAADIQLHDIPHAVESLLMSQWHGSVAWSGVSP